MKKSVITLVTIIIAFANLIQAQSLEEVLENHFEAVGQDKFATFQSYYLKGKLSEQGTEMPTEMKIKKTGQFLITATMQGEKMIQGFDGGKGWMIESWKSPRPVELSPAQLKQAQDQTDMEGELYNYKKKGSTADFAGKVTLDGREAYRIKLNTSDGNKKDYFIDAQTYYITKVRAQVLWANGQTYVVEQIMSDYKLIDDVIMPMKIETKSPMGTQFLKMEEVRFNQQFDDSIFKRPA